MNDTINLEDFQAGFVDVLERSAPEDPLEKEAFYKAISGAAKALKGLGVSGFNGLRNLPSRAAGAVSRKVAGEFSKGYVDDVSRIAGKYTSSADLASKAGVSESVAKKILASKAGDVVTTAAKEGDEALKFGRDAFGNVLDMNSKEKYTGVGAMIRNSLSPTEWGKAFRRTTRPMNNFQIPLTGKLGNFDLTKYKGKTGMALRRLGGFLGEELSPGQGSSFSVSGVTSTALNPLTFNALDLAMAETPEERREVFTSNIPASLVSNVAANLGGGRGSFAKQWGAYFAAKYLWDKIPGARAQRYAGRTDSQVNEIAQQYGTTPERVKEYLKRYGSEGI